MNFENFQLYASNFISQDLAIKLGIKAEELGRELDVKQIFQGESVLVTPLIGKLWVHIQEYVDQEDFLISPLRHYDAVNNNVYTYMCVGTPTVTRISQVYYFQRCMQG